MSSFAAKKHDMYACRSPDLLDSISLLVHHLLHPLHDRFLGVPCGVKWHEGRDLGRERALLELFLTLRFERLQQSSLLLFDLPAIRDESCNSTRKEHGSERYEDDDKPFSSSSLGSALRASSRACFS